MVCGRLAHVPMSLQARTSVLDMCMVENVLDSWAVGDLVENRSDSLGYNTLDCDAIGALIFRGSVTLVASPVFVFHSITF